ncbi:Transcriptional regulator, TetR family [Marinilactibacillus psychrotolerans 42ea]|uniref:Transcriptional regulator, TetR family n=1 Tax=Marinilactibacillus psychrotolerans 42ea TaxID=1255609 RepID=A0A1R4I9I1_9LACT|nr:TetR/AcrR family transcriptional regulator [Marinilactibacillus psychrotolerans]SJN16472.1 Transcriptional regulator, TetR family [Marinilactibacillus psychrotolerans 42ea]
MDSKSQNILDNAETLFYKHGFHAVGIKKIVSQAKVSIMTLYNHFGSKENLIIQVLDQREIRFMQYLKHALNDKTQHSKYEMACTIAFAHMNWLKGNSNGCLFLRAKEEYDQINQDITRRVDTHKRSMLSFYKKLGFSEKEAMRFAIQIEGATALAETIEVDEVEKELVQTLRLLFTT